MTNLKTTEDKLLDQLISGCGSTSDLFGTDGLFARLKKRLIEQAMSAEMDNHLGYKKHEIAGQNSGIAVMVSLPRRLLVIMKALILKFPETAMVLLNLKSFLRIAVSLMALMSKF